MSKYSFEFKKQVVNAYLNGEGKFLTSYYYLSGVIIIAKIIGLRRVFSYK